MRAATAIELVHMATLVHDDVLDAAPLRRGRPTVAATSGRDRATATGDLLFSRAFALLAGAGDLRAIELLSARLGGARPGRAGPAPRRLRHLDLRGALPGALPAEDRDAVRVRLPARPRRGGAGRLRRRDRPRLPAARRRARRLRAAGADRQGARHRPARRHRHPAPDPRRRARPRDRSPSTCARLDAAARRGALRPDRGNRRARAGPLARPGDGRRSASAASARPASTPSSASCSTWSPTASSSATAERAQREVVGGDQVRGEGGREGLGDSAACSRARAPASSVGERLGAVVERLVVGVDLVLAVDAVAAPLALGAAPPEAPVPALRRLLPAGRLHQLRAALGADVKPGVCLRPCAARVAHA